MRGKAKHIHEVGQFITIYLVVSKLVDVNKKKHKHLSIHSEELIKKHSANLQSYTSHAWISDETIAFTVNINSQSNNVKKK